MDNTHLNPKVNLTEHKIRVEENVVGPPGGQGAQNLEAIFTSILFQIMPESYSNY